MTDTSFIINPGRGLGWISLDASLHAVLTRLKSHQDLYPKIEVLYSHRDPVQSPIIVNLPGNGIRLRFDGSNQRLCLIEIVDFHLSNFIYKSQDLVRRSATSSDREQIGPSFKHLYNRLFGPSYPGEYIPPSSKQKNGTYVLSWPGLAARFSVKHQSWSARADFVSQLDAHASPAESIAIFAGSSWSEIRSTLYNKRANVSRPLASASKGRDVVPDDIAEVLIHENGGIEVVRCTMPPFSLVLGETTSQDLVMELGPPNAIFKRPSGSLSINATQVTKLPQYGSSQDRHLPTNEHEQAQVKARSTELEFEGNEVHGEQSLEGDYSIFYNYFDHGLDIMMGPSRNSECLVATKLFLHGNIPGSHSFNQHRRSRWQILLDDNGLTLPVTSEMKFQEISAILEDMRPAQQQKLSGNKEQQGMVLNRGWAADASPDSSIELLGGFEEESDETSPVDAVASNTVLFGYPGFLFEVLKDDNISCLTIYGGTSRRDR